MNDAAYLRKLAEDACEKHPNRAHRLDQIADRLESLQEAYAAAANYYAMYYDARDARDEYAAEIIDLKDELSRVVRAGAHD